jgi:type II secretory pathway pseudopilin PulG
MKFQLSPQLVLIASLLGATASTGIGALTHLSAETAPHQKQLGPIFRARQDEAKQYISTINKAQQAYYLEHGRFTAKLPELGVSIPSETASYRYKITRVESRKTLATAAAKQAGLRSYTGVVYVFRNNTTISAICQTNAASNTPPPSPQIILNNIQCPSGSTKL